MSGSFYPNFLQYFRGMTALGIEAFSQFAEQGLTIIDTRSTESLKQGYIKGSILLCSPAIFGAQIGAISGFSLSSGFSPVLLVGDAVQDFEPFLKQAPDGSNNWVKGYLEGGFEAWKKAGGSVDLIIDVEVDELIMDIPFDENLVIMDTRSAVNFGNGHLKDAVSLPLAQINDPLRISAIEENDNLYIVGENDDEAFLAATILKKQDIHNLRVVLGGWEAIQSEKKAQIVKEPGMLN